MPPNPLPRKLAAILYADVAGYSRLSGVDEEGTHRILSAYLDAISTTVREHGGSVLHFAGDAVLADFATVTEGLSCAAEVQRDLHQRNLDVSDDQKVEFRIGVNLGEVIVDREEIYGEGVNIAARLESLAVPGGVCISGTVYDAVSARLPLEYEYLGERSVKNIEKPIRAYRVLLGFESSIDPEPMESASSSEAVGASIAVLPFHSRSGDAEQGYFADGITEDLIIALSKFRWFSVIARNSTVDYRGPAENWKRAADGLRVRYVLEGSVRHAGGRIRITAQLIDAQTGSHLWAEKYDRAAEDVFAVQDEITRRIASAIEPELFAREGERIEFEKRGSLDAWDCFMRAQMHVYSGTEEDNLKAQELAQEAISTMPTSPHGYKLLAWSRILAGRHGWTDPRGPELQEARDAALKALELDPKDAFSHQVMGNLHFAFGDLDAAIQELEMAIELNPSSPFAYSLLAASLAYAGRPEEALERIRVAEQISPRDPMLPWFQCTHGLTHWALGDYEQAIECTSYAVRNTKRWLPSRWVLAASNEKLGRHDEAKKALDMVFEIIPDFSVEKLRQRAPFSDPSDFNNLADTLRKVGLPD